MRIGGTTITVFKQHYRAIVGKQHGIDTMSKTSVGKKTVSLTMVLGQLDYQMALGQLDCR